MTILLVDDDAKLLELMTVMLKARGFHVLAAPGVTEALALSRAHAFDALVTDIVLKDLDGWTLARLLIEQKAGLPVVFISGYSLDFKEQLNDYPKSLFLQKPFRAADLVNAITAVTAAFEKSP